MTAGMYASRDMLQCLLIEKGAQGGQVLTTDWIDNYPGFTDGITGFDLVEKMSAHAARFELQTLTANIVSTDLKSTPKVVHLENGKTLTAQCIIICSGGSPGKLNIPGEKDFIGRGVSYCATCDGPFYKDQEIAVVGGGNTAIQEAGFLTRFARKVTVIHRRKELRATKIVQEIAFANKKIDFIFDAEVAEVKGSDNGVEELVLSHNNGTSSTLAATGIFILIGVVPNNSMLPMDELVKDDYGFIVTDTEMRTSLPGVFAAGDIRSKSFRQIVNAAGEGATAELSAEHYLAGL